MSAPGTPGAAARRTRPLRVALDATPLLGRPTGVGIFCAGLLGALAARDDVDPRAYALTWRGRDALDAVLPTGVAPPRPRRPMAARPLRTAWSHLDRPRLEAWTGPVDVVHATNFVLPPSRAPGLVTVHDLTCVRFPELCTADTLAYPGLIRRALRRGAHVHCVSAFVAAEVRETFGVPAERVHVVPNGAPPTPPGDPARGRVLAGGGRYVLAVGTVEPRKDLPGLVAAFDAVAGTHPDVALVLAGPDGWGAAALDDALSRSHLGDRVRRLGWVPDADRADLVAGATLLAYPSRYEGFGLPPLEAMAAGVAVVATAAGAVPEVVGDAARLVPVGDVDALAGALDVLLGDDAARAAVATRGPARAARFTWTAAAAGLAGVYRTLASAV